jgi:hypothetical protein
MRETRPTLVFTVNGRPLRFVDERRSDDPVEPDAPGSAS